MKLTALATLALAVGAVTVAHAQPLTLAPKTPDRFSADKAFYAVVLDPQTFCRSIGLQFVMSGPGCGGMIVHDHKPGPASPIAFRGANGNNFVGIPDDWWQAVEDGRISAAYLQIVVAHEEGHLRCGHHLGGAQSRARELVADRFAGAAMRWLWYNERRSPEYIKAAIVEAYGKLGEDEFHPAAQERMDAFTAGYFAPETAIC